MINLTELLDRAKKKALEKPDAKDGYAPKSTDELRFKKKHVVQKTDDRNGNKDDVFKATNIKTLERAKERHGYNPDEDEQVYEGYEEIRFDDPENNSKSSGSSEPKRNRSKLIDDMMNKLGNEHGQKNLASKIKQRYSAKNEEAQEQSSENKKSDRLAAIAAAAKKKNAQIGKTIVTGSRGGVGGAETRRYPAGTLRNSYEPEGEELDEAVPYTLGGKIDKENTYKVHTKDWKGNWSHTPGDVYHSLSDAQTVARNMKKGELGRTEIISEPLPFLKDEKKSNLPEFNTVPCYDGKGWKYVPKNTGKNIWFWNVAGNIILPENFDKSKIKSYKNWNKNLKL